MTLFRFGDFEADDCRFELRRSGRAVHVQRIVLETIFFLIKSDGRAVSKTDLLRGPWRGNKVSDAAVARAVMLARRALDDSSSRMIATVHGVGYRFLAAVAESPPDQRRDGRAVVSLTDRARALDLDKLRFPTPWTARPAELPMLHRALEESRRGRGWLVLVKGEAGAGKTALVEYFAEQCQAQGTLVAWGRAWDFRSAPPLWHWLEIVRSCGDSLAKCTRSEDEAMRRRWALLVGEFERLSKQSGGDSPLRLFDEVTRALDQLSHSRSLVLVLEGLQDADNVSLRLLDFVRQRLGQMPLLIVATSRPVPSRTLGHRALDEGAPHLHVVELAKRTAREELFDTGALMLRKS